MKENILSVEREREELQSKVISFLRFPLCVAVVFIHIHIGTKDGITYPMYDSLRYFFADILARVAVPLFFMFSGFLFFKKSEQLTFANYKEKLTKRCRTLLIPYLFWNSTPILYYLLGRLLGLGSHYGVGFNFIDWLKPFWNNYPIAMNGEGIASYPICIQFWYIRDLMVTILLSPIIYWLTKNLRFYFIIALAMLWLTNCWPLITGLNITAIFFFSLGTYCAIFKRNFAEILKPHTLLLGAVYILTVVPVLIEQDANFNPLRRIGILLGMAFIVSLTARYISNGQWKTNKFLSESSFFIFAFHMTALLVIQETVHFSSSTDIICTVLYFSKSSLIVIGGLVLYYLLKKWMPRFTAIITGGR